MLCLYCNKSETPEKRRHVIGRRKKMQPTSLFTLCHRTHNAITPRPHAIAHHRTPRHAIAHHTHYPTHKSKSMIRTLLSRVGNKKH